VILKEIPTRAVEFGEIASPASVAALRSGQFVSFRWQWAPEGLATRRQLREAGLCPGGAEPVAELRRGRLRADLYDVARARPKRTPTPAQLEALEAAMRARRTCRRCGIDAGFCLPRSADACPTCHIRDQVQTEGQAASASSETRRAA
jgi:hypothetical protein